MIFLLTVYGLFLLRDLISCDIIIVTISNISKRPTWQRSAANLLVEGKAVSFT